MPAPRIVIITGDLVEQHVDAIVNAANNDLLLGGGVAGAIRSRGGPAIQQECSAHGPVKVGEAAITGGGELPVRHVIHAASMQLGGRTTAASLRSSMDHVFRLAHEHGVRTIAVPAVGTGIAGFRWMSARTSWRIACRAPSRPDGSRKRSVLCSLKRTPAVFSIKRFGPAKARPKLRFSTCFVALCARSG